MIKISIVGILISVTSFILSIPLYKEYRYPFYFIAFTSVVSLLIISNKIDVKSTLLFISLGVTALSFIASYIIEKIQQKKINQN